ncbi:unnamed protein product [Vitrella brassicaformis CCMP3155]|uniref:Sulfatase N-terminal domain-containing protein n=5 Tax=Vitrella brassicaformis TaxID=1169539 RepID=A0A0G4G7W5_VITBC|nr:unnamed protein product [Vitrella brassicaformis CCMP3155]|eukprot:CEM24712.1 unnamed protein product [Vitrella brassicaformis CCMP3155]
MLREDSDESGRLQDDERNKKQAQRGYHHSPSASSNRTPAASSQPPLSRPNFVIVIADDLRWDAVGYAQKELAADKHPPFREALFPWMQEATPNIDRLAAGGARFRNAYVTLSSCSASRACMLTGRYNFMNGVYRNNDELSSDMPTYACLLGDAGYKTAYIGKWHMGKQSERPCFQWYRTYIGSATYYHMVFYKEPDTAPLEERLIKRQGWVDKAKTDFFTEFLEEHQATSHDQPFLVTIGLKAPHKPFLPGKGHAFNFTGIEPKLSRNHNTAPPFDAGMDTEPFSFYGSEDGFSQTLENYSSLIASLDDSVGRVYAALEERGLLDNTVIMFVSDNGLTANNHQLSFYKFVAYEESIRVPLAIHYPALIKRNTVIDQTVLNVDIAPTLLDFAGLEVPPYMQGISFMPLLDAAQRAEVAPFWWPNHFAYVYLGLKDDAVSEAASDVARIPTCMVWRTGESVGTQPDAKLTEYPQWKEWTELFRLDDDPEETANLANGPKYAPLLQKLREEMDDHMMDLSLYQRSPVYRGTALPHRLYPLPLLEWPFDHESTEDIRWRDAASNLTLVGNATLTRVADTLLQTPYYQPRLTNNALQLSYVLTFVTQSDRAIVRSPLLWRPFSVRTITLWVQLRANPDDAVYQLIYSEGTDTTGLQLRVELRSLVAKLKVDGEDYSVTAPYTATEWTAVAVQVDVTKALSLYMSGLRVGRMPLSSLSGEEILTIEADASLGASASDVADGFVGMLDDIRIYDDAANVGSITFKRQARMVARFNFEDSLTDELLQNEATVQTELLQAEYPLYDAEDNPRFNSTTISFDGDYHLILESDLLSRPCRSFTLMVFLKLVRLEEMQLVYEEGGHGGGLSLTLWDGSLRLAIADHAAGVEKTYSAAYPEAEWNHVTVTFDGRMAEGPVAIYINAVQVLSANSTLTQIGDISASWKDAAIGGSAGTVTGTTSSSNGTTTTVAGTAFSRPYGRFMGWMDELTIWDIALSDSQIRDMRSIRVVNALITTNTKTDTTPTQKQQK